MNLVLSLILVTHKAWSTSNHNLNYYHYNFPPQYWDPDYSEARPKCELNIDGTDADNLKPEGEIVRSPEYQDSYPRGIKCTYTFTTNSDMRTQIIFTQFDLYLPPTVHIVSGEDTSGKCHASYDHVAVSVDVDGRQSVLDVFCGQITPPQLMSARNIITLEFITHTPAVNNSLNKGFQFLYKFVRDFGIQSGRKQDSGCRFVYNSSEANNGTVYSPNYPGYYPRSTNCHYEFTGRPDEQIYIYFTYFDVEGYSQCENETESDYILFSNFETADRKNIRYCGANKPEQQTSEKNYLRMIFHANNIFDATGFFALYQFTTKRYTPQYLDFNPLLSKYATRGFHVLAFPCNQFHLQEPGKNYEILNGLKYVRPGGGWEPHQNLTIHAKLEVNGANAHPMYQMLRKACPQTVTNLGKREYMMYDPMSVNDLVWNFEKFIIDREGRPRYRFHPAAWGANGSFVEQKLIQFLEDQENPEMRQMFNFLKIFPLWSIEKTHKNETA